MAVCTQKSEFIFISFCFCAYVSLSVCYKKSLMNLQMDFNETLLKQSLDVNCLELTTQPILRLLS